MITKAAKRRAIHGIEIECQDYRQDELAAMTDETLLNVYCNGTNFVPSFETQTLWDVR